MGCGTCGAAPQARRGAGGWHAWGVALAGRGLHTSRFPAGRIGAHTCGCGCAWPHTCAGRKDIDTRAALLFGALAGAPRQAL